MLFRSRWEGFGQTLAEALVVGTPVVAADCVSGPRLLLDDGARGDLVPVDDVAALADAIERHLRDPAVLRDKAEPARAWAAENLDVGRTAAGVLAVLGDVVMTRARTRAATRARARAAVRTRVRAAIRSRVRPARPRARR